MLRGTYISIGAPRKVKRHSRIFYADQKSVCIAARRIAEYSRAAPLRTALLRAAILRTARLRTAICRKQTFDHREPRWSNSALSVNRRTNLENHGIGGAHSARLLISPACADQKSAGVAEPIKSRSYQCLIAVACDEKTKRCQNLTKVFLKVSQNVSQKFWQNFMSSKFQKKDNTTQNTQA